MFCCLSTTTNTIITKLINPSLIYSPIITAHSPHISYEMHFILILIDGQINKTKHVLPYKCLRNYNDNIAGEKNYTWKTNIYFLKVFVFFRFYSKYMFILNCMQRQLLWKHPSIEVLTVSKISTSALSYHFAFLG